MKIKLNDFLRQWAETSDGVMAAVADVGSSGWYVLGREVGAFEAALADWTKIPWGVGCANGLDAIEIALRATELAPGGKVLTTPLSAFATTLAIVRAGGVPVFVDTDPSGLVDLVAARRVLEADRSIRHFVPVHLFGHPCDLEQLKDISADLGVVVIEDMAQAIGATWKGAPVGSVGALAATSFYPTKNLGALGDGGAILTCDSVLAAKCRVIRDYGQSSKYVHDEIGLNSRLDELHAAILNKAHLPRLTHWTSARRRVAASYLEGIDNPLVRPLTPPECGGSVWHLFPVMVEPASREAFMRYMGERGVQTGVHYPKAIPDQCVMGRVAHVIAQELTECRRLAESEVSLPIHPYLTKDEIACVVSAVNGWCGE